MKMFLKIKHQGQTLVEVLITVLIIGVGVISLLKFQNYLAYEDSLTQQKGDAIILAMKDIETAKDFQVLNNTSGYTSYQSIASTTSTTTVANTVFTITRTVTSFTNPSYKRVDVNVSWTDRYGGAQSIRLVTNIAAIDPTNSATIM